MTAERPATTRLTGMFLMGLARFFSGATARWVDCQPDTCQRVYFANHSSHLDAIMVWAMLPPEVRIATRPVAAKDYWMSSRFRKHIAASFNAILIDRQDIKVHQSPVDLMLREIGDKYSLIVFPEGQRSQGGIVGEFKSGLYYLAKKRPDLELVPVYLKNLDRVLPRDEFLPIPLMSNVIFGPPIWLETKESKVDFLKRARSAVLRLKEGGLS